MKLRTCNSSVKDPFTCKAFYILYAIFAFFGICMHDTYNSQWKRLVITIWKYIAIMTVCGAPITILCVFRVHVDVNYDILKMVLSVILSDAFSVLLWFSVLKSKKRILSVVRKVMNMDGLYRFRPHASLVIMSLIFIISLHFSSYFALLYPYNTVRYKAYFSNYVFGFTVENTQITFYVVCLTHFLYTTFIVTFPSSLVSLYIVLCQHLQMGMSAHTKRNRQLLSSHRVTSSDISKCFKRYNSILSIFQEFERSMAFLIFVAFSKSVYEIFRILLILSKSIKAYGMKYFIVCSIHSLVHFIVISFLASSVHDADVLARDTNADILERMPIDGISDINMKFTFLNKNNATAFTLTGWKFFSFTRGFFLVACGCILTYAVLVINV